MTADEVTDALIRDGDRIAAEIEGASVQTAGDAGLLITGLPVPTLNSVLTIRTSAARADVERLLDIVAATGLPHSLSLRPGCDPGLTDLARNREMTEDESIPLMAMHPTADYMRKAAVHPELTIRMLEPHEAGIHAAVGAEAFQAPLETFERFTPPSVLRLPGFRAYVGTRDGEPVATSAGSTLGEHVGVFDVATLEKHRGRGYGAALTARAVLDGIEAGASTAYLQSSAMGYKIYERLGFRTLEVWPTWVSVPSRS